MQISSEVAVSVMCCENADSYVVLYERADMIYAGWDTPQVGRVIKVEADLAWRQSGRPPSVRRLVSSRLHTPPRRPGISFPRSGCFTRYDDESFAAAILCIPWLEGLRSYRSGRWPA